MDITIAPLSESDAAEVVALMRRTEKIDHHTVYTLWQSFAFDRDLFLTARDSGVLCGYVFGRMLDEERGFLWQVAVDADCRRHGIGKALVTAFIRQAMAMGAQSILTTVTPGNTASERLMRSSAAGLGLSIDTAGDTGDFAGQMKPETIWHMQK